MRWGRTALGIALGCAGAGAAPAPAMALDRAHAPLLDRRDGTAGVPAGVQRARDTLVRSLGPQAFLSVDRVTGAVRFLGATDRYLSGRATGDPAAVALRWVRAHRDVLGLRAEDMRTFRLAHRYTSPIGVTRLIFRQTYRGIPALDSTLRVNVARDGRIVNVGGSPRGALRVARTTPRLSAAQAMRAAARAVGAAPLSDLRILRASRGPRRTTHFAGRHHARLVLVATGPRTARLGWRIWFEESDDAVWSVVVDAGTGALVRRANQVKHASGLAWDNYPGAPKGGDPRVVDYSPWLTAQDRLLGNNTHVYNDADSSEDFTTDPVDPTQESMGDLVLPHEEIRPQDFSSGDWLYEYTPIPSPTGFCPPAGCAWNHHVNGSWLPNRDQDGTQVFFFVNRFHDHLNAEPISFTEAAGNFQFENHSGRGKGNDGVYASSMDAAAQAGGRPVPVLWSDNANMLTRPDGFAPRMQMFLFEPIQVGPILDYPFSDVSGGSDASIIYHEYTHGLSNRLVIDAEGEGALNAAQSGAMGEAWSDFYAMDFLMRQGFEEDTPAPGEIKVGRFVDGGQNLVRTEPIDCTLGASLEACPRRRSPLASEGGGGYTYEHFGRVAGSAQVHADGEIWSQTLMDLRRRLVADHGPLPGSDRLLTYVTRGMELSVDEPSFIDMRNAILQADLLTGRRDHRRIWDSFAARGMGVSASAADGKDVAPVAGFDLPAGIEAADMLAPAVSIDTPAQSAVVRAGVVTFRGTATDDANVTALKVDGVPTAISAGKWSLKVRLAAGRRTITAEAVDVEGRTARASRTVRADGSKPKLRRVSLRGRRLRATAVDDTGIARATVDGRRAKVGRSGRIDVRVRRSKVKLVVTDLAGRRLTRTVRRR